MSMRFSTRMLSSRNVRRLGLLAWFGAMFTMAFAETGDIRPLLQDLQKAVAEGRAEDSRRIREQIQQYGKEAVPYLRESLRIGSERTKSQCLWILGGIGADESTELLLEVYLDSSNKTLAQNALGFMGDRPIRRRLTEREAAVFAENIISLDSPVSSAATARVLSMCRSNDAGQLIPPILRRFVCEVEDPREVGTSGWPGYLSPRAAMLNQFLLAFRNIGPAGVPAVQDVMRRSSDPLVRKWLLLALEFMKDPQAASQLLTVLEIDPDRYTRALALRAYAISAGKAAIPILRKFLNDTTESEYGGCDPQQKKLLFQIVARSELLRLEKEP